MSPMVQLVAKDFVRDARWANPESGDPAQLIPRGMRGLDIPLRDTATIRARS